MGDTNDENGTPAGNDPTEGAGSSGGADGGPGRGGAGGGPEASAVVDPMHVQIVLDRSGSMSPIAAATVDAVNGFLAKQRAQPGMLRLSLADFDSQEPFRVVVDAVPIAEVLDLAQDDFEPRGGTPLFDAVGEAIRRGDIRVEVQPDEDQMIVIVTDGHENASVRYSGSRVATLLEARQKAGWVVLFLGANQDSASVAEGLGMHAGNAADFDATPAGIADVVDLAAEAVALQRSRSQVERARFSHDLVQETRRTRSER